MAATLARPPGDARHAASEALVPTSLSEASCQLIESCALGASEEELGQQLVALCPSAEGVLREEQVQLWQSAVSWLLIAPHQRPNATAASLRAMGAALTGQSGLELQEKALAWLLEVTGTRLHGRGLGDAADTGVRWRACHLLDGFLRGTSGQGFARLPATLRDACGKILLARCADRSQDVRLAASESLPFLGLDAQVLEVLRDRATQDCSAHVRATCTAALLSLRTAEDFDELDQRVVLRASLDASPRVRRRLFTALPNPCAEGCFQSAWCQSVLRGLGDRNKSVRLAATRSLVWDLLESGDRPVFLSDADAAAGAVGRIAKNLEAVVRQPNLENSEAERDASALKVVQALLRRMDVAKAMACIGPSSTRAAAVFARVAAELSARLGDKPAAEVMVRVMRKSLDTLESAADLETANEANYDLRHLLYASLVAELPPETEGRKKLVEAAGAAMTVTPVFTAASTSPVASFLCGREAEPLMPVMSLAFLLLRKVYTEDGTGAQTRHEVDPKAEAALSKCARNIYAFLKKEAEAAEGELRSRENEKEQLAQDLDDQRWAEEASRRQLVASSRSCSKELEQALQAKREQVEDARDFRDKSCLRVLMLSTTWLQYCRVPLAVDPAQSRLLDQVLMPLVQNEEKSADMQVEALHAIAIYASKCKDQALGHWDFFMGILQEQQFDDPATLQLGLPLLEIAVLFVCDVLLVHKEAMREKRPKATVLLARTLRSLDALDSRAGRLRCVLLDRCCSLLLLGIAEGSAAAWLLGRLLGEVCDRAAAPRPARPKGSVLLPAQAGPEKDYLCLGLPAQRPREVLDEPTAAEEEAVAGEAAQARRALCMRLLQFFKLLPCLSEAHAGLLVAAAEAFFAARLYARDACGSQKALSLPSALRAARFVCLRLGHAKDALSAHGLDATELQLKVLKSVAAALLSGSHAEAKGLSDALASATLACASAAGGSPFEWAGDKAPSLREALRSLLCDWSPATSARMPSALLSEIHAPGRASAEAGREFAEDCMETAAELRLDLAALGLAAPIPGVPRAGNVSCLPNRRVGYWQPKPQEPAAQRPGSDDEVAEDEEQLSADDGEDDLIKRWEVVDQAGQRLALVPRGGGLTVGRHPSCDICVSVAAVSSRHCVLACLAGSGDKESLVLRDLGSANGTFVNGIHIRGGSELGLSGGDAISLAARDGYALSVRLCRVSPSLASPQREKRPAEEAAEPRRVRPRTKEDASVPAQGEPPNQEAPGVPRRLRRKTPDPAWTGEALAPPRKIRRRLRRKTRDTEVTDVQKAAPPRAEQAHGCQDDVAEAPKAQPPAPAAVGEEPEPSPGVAGAGGGVEQVAMAVLQAKASRLEGPRLVDLGSGQVVQLPRDGLVAIGRRADCEVVIPRSVVSGRHCVLLCSADGIQLEDVSSNGTFVNETQVPKGFSLPQRVTLRDGDHIYLAHRQGPSLLFLSGQEGDEESEYSEGSD